MKKLLCALLLLQAPLAMADAAVNPPYDGTGSAKYEVPTGPDLAAFANYALPDYSAHLKDGQLTVAYALPLTLTGLENHETFTGPVQNGVAAMRGPSGSMDCDVATKMCKVKYTDLNFDLVQVQKALAPLNLSSEELDGKLAVAAKFGGDMEGEIYLPEID